MRQEHTVDRREPHAERLDVDLVVVGGGLAGTCCAIAAARADLRVALVQDRPVLGGNASSEVRLWVLGATCHMGNNNRWSREGGIVDEILVENVWRNPEGNPILFDALLLEKVVEQPNITLLLNTAAHAVQKTDARTIRSVQAFCSQNQTLYDLHAPLFADASGDGIVAHQAGASFRMGAEDREEFDEGFAPDEGFGHLLGHSIYFYAKDAGKPVQFHRPSWAMTWEQIREQIPRHKWLSPQMHGCRLWWLEYGGRLDTISASEDIKWQLWKIVYGVWDYIKNSGKFPEAANMTLEWVGMIPGKRESRRFDGLTMLTQHDVVQRTRHYDTVAHGGWSIDLHPADGVYSEIAPSLHLHPRGVFGIPFRSYVAKDLDNLMLAGRIISASHVAFGSTRVMATCGAGGQAVGIAAALCCRNDVPPRELASQGLVSMLQRELLRTGQHIPGEALDDPDDLARQAEITASSTLALTELGDDGPPLRLNRSHALLLPAPAGPFPRLTLQCTAEQATRLCLQLRTSERPDEFAPSTTLATREVDLQAGRQEVTVDFECEIGETRYVFLCLMANERVSVATTQTRVTGLTLVQYAWTQTGLEERGGETLEFWTPPRRPSGHLPAVHFAPGLEEAFAAENVVNGLDRPTHGANAWAARLDDAAPSLTLRWDQPQALARVELVFDTDRDHALESVHCGHPERIAPMCVKHYRLRNAAGEILTEVEDHHQTRATHEFAEPVETDRLTLEVLQRHGNAPAAIFSVRCYGG
ncbi:MAG: FAD-dependent oxidoreductase [Planctomycetota bacterium]